MINGPGISTYFKNEKIRIRYKTIIDLDYPEYIHLRINEERKYLFIEKCSRDIDAFRIRYSHANDGKRVNDLSCYINAKNFLEYMAGVIGVPTDSPSLRFSGKLMPDGTIFVDLNHYEVIEPKSSGNTQATAQ